MSNNQQISGPQVGVGMVVVPKELIHHMSQMMHKFDIFTGVMMKRDGSLSEFSKKMIDDRKETRKDFRENIEYYTQQMYNNLSQAFDSKLDMSDKSMKRISKNLDDYMKTTMQTFDKSQIKSIKDAKEFIDMSRKTLERSIKNITREFQDNLERQYEDSKKMVEMQKKSSWVFNPLGRLKEEMDKKVSAVAESGLTKLGEKTGIAALKTLGKGVGLIGKGITLEQERRKLAIEEPEGTEAYERTMKVVGHTSKEAKELLANPDKALKKMLSMYNENILKEYPEYSELVKGMRSQKKIFKILTKAIDKDIEEGKEQLEKITSDEAIGKIAKETHDKLVEYFKELGHTDPESRAGLFEGRGIKSKEEYMTRIEGKPTAASPASSNVIDTLDSMEKSVKDLTKHATKKGSIYSHDIYSEKLLTSIKKTLDDIKKIFVKSDADADSEKFMNYSSETKADRDTKDLLGAATGKSGKAEATVAGEAESGIGGFLGDAATSIIGGAIGGKIAKGKGAVTGAAKVAGKGILGKSLGAIGRAAPWIALAEVGYGGYKGATMSEKGMNKEVEKLGTVGGQINSIFNPIQWGKNIAMFDRQAFGTVKEVYDIKNKKLNEMLMGNKVYQKDIEQLRNMGVSEVEIKTFASISDDQLRFKKLRELKTKYGKVKGEDSSKLDMLKDTERKVAASKDINTNIKETESKQALVQNTQTLKKINDGITKLNEKDPVQFTTYTPARYKGFPKLDERRSWGD